MQRRFRPINYPQTAATVEINDLSAAVTWANIPDANVPESAVTQHEAALTILETQITDGSLLARVGAAESIAETWTWTGGGDKVNFTGSTGPIGIGWRSSGATTAQQIDLVYRTTPDTLAFERVSDSALILDLDATALSVAIGGALTAVSYGGITEANLVDKTADETISGEYTFTNTAGMTIGDGDNADDEVLIHFNIDRSWRFIADGIGASSILALRSNNDKAFKIQSSTSVSQFHFQTSQTGPYFRISNAAGSDYVQFDHDGIDFNFTGVNTTDLNISGMDINMQDNKITRAELDDYSISDTDAVVSANAVTAAYVTSQSYNINLDAATGTVAITISGGPPTGNYGEMVIRIQQDSTADRVLTWAGGTFIWAVDGVIVDPKTGSDAITVYHLQTWDAGTTWYISGVPYGV